MSTDRSRNDNESCGGCTSFELENPFRNIQYSQTEKETEYESALQSNQISYESELENPFVQSERGDSEQYEQEQFANVHELDKEDEFELFSNFVHDTEFEQLITDLVTESEPKFVNYLRADNPSLTELEQALKVPDIETKFDHFFTTSYDPLANKISSEVDRFSSYLSENLHPEMDFENAQEVIDRFEVIEPEQLFGRIGRFLKKVGKAASSTIKKVGSFAAKALLKPLLAKIKRFVRPFLRKVVSMGLRYIPSQYRSLAQSAVAALGENEMNKLEASENESPPSLEMESLGETLLESEDETEGLLNDGETESFDQEFDIGEIVGEFDRYIFETNETEFEGIPSSEEFASVSEETAYESPPISQLTSGDNEALILDDARNKFINGLINESQPDIQKLTQEFVPPLIPVLKGAITIAGRDRVVDFIASIAAKLLNPLVGQQFGNPLSKIVTDVGLRLMALETPEPVPGKELMAQMVTNIIGETLESVSELPQSILEGEDEVLQSFIHEVMVESIENNIPEQALNKQALVKRRIPSGSNWIHRDKGRHKELSSTYKLTLNPNIAQRIKTWRHGETLYDVLRKYQRWDGKAPIPVTIHIFEPVIGTRLSKIASKHLGGSGPEYVRQILPLSKTAATLLLKDPTLATRKRIRTSKKGVPFKSRWKRFYYVKISPSTGSIGNKASMANVYKSTVAATPVEQGRPTIMGRATLRSNDINIRFLDPTNLEARVYLNGDTIRGIKGATKNKIITQLLGSVEGLVLSNGSRYLQNLFLRLKVPPHTTKEIVNLLLGMVLRNLNKNAGYLASRFGQLQESQEGMTLILNLALPRPFLRSLPKGIRDTFSGFISKLFANPSLRIQMVPNYRL